MKLVAQKRRQHHLKQIGTIPNNEVNQSGNLVLDTSIKTNLKPEKAGEKLQQDEQVPDNPLKRQNSQKKEGELIFEQLRINKQ